MTLHEFKQLLETAADQARNDAATVTIPARLARVIVQALHDSAQNNRLLLQVAGEAIAAGECEHCRLEFFERRFGEAPLLAVDAAHNATGLDRLGDMLTTAIGASAKPKATAEDMLNRYMQIADQVSSLAPRHNDSPRITALLREARKIETDLAKHDPVAGITLPLESLRRVSQARTDRLALLADEYKHAKTFRDGGRRARDIASEIEAIGGQAPAGAAWPATAQA
jgi:hypothetical protein